MREIFEDLIGYEDSYQISDQGRVFTKRRLDGNRIIYGKELRPVLTKDGYLKVSLCKDSVETKYYLHRLVAKQFIPNPNNLPQVNHIDGNKFNNCVTNLEWCTKQENQQHAVTHLLMQHGSNRPGAKLTEDKVLEIYKLKGIMSAKEIGKYYGVSKNTINLILRGKKWSYLYNQHFNMKQQEILDNQQPSCK